MPLRSALPALSMAFGLAIAATLATAPAAAQSLTVEDIRAQIEAERAAPNPYEEILSDPDPLVARRAMEIMLEQGNAEQRRIALDFGLHSPDPAVRHIALGAWLASSPRMEFVFENAGTPEETFNRVMSRRYGTAPNSQGQSIWITNITGYDAQRECFTNSGGCLFRHTENGTWISKMSYWQEVGLNDAGELSGTIDTHHSSTRARVTFRVPPP